MEVAQTNYSPDQLRGLIIRSQSGFYTVRTEAGDIECRLRGRLKKGPREGDVVAIGDWVRLTSIGDKRGVIEEIEERKRMLSRMAPLPSGEYQQIIIANPDQAAFIFACANPAPRYGMLDRYLVIAEKQEIPAIIVVNKIDLIDVDEAQEMFQHYEEIGYPVIYTSAKTAFGLETLRDRLVGKITLFTGPSGAGKSSLLNAIQPELGLLIRAVSQATQKGRHTTVARQMFPLRGGGYVADTPGLRALALWDIAPEEIDGYFPEIRTLVAQCAFSDCTHLHEPECAVQLAVDQGKVHPERYSSYVRMRLGQEEQAETW